MSIELDQCREKVNEYEALRLRFVEREAEMRLKDEMIDEKDRKISNLQVVSERMNHLVFLNERTSLYFFLFFRHAMLLKKELLS